MPQAELLRLPPISTAMPPKTKKRMPPMCSAGQTLRITETNYWKRRHSDVDPHIPPTKVGTKSNCEACHGDTQAGLFEAQAINIPKSDIVKRSILAVAMFLMATPIAMAAGPQDAVLAALEAQAKAADAGFAGFSARAARRCSRPPQRRKPNTPSCTTCPPTRCEHWQDARPQGHRPHGGLRQSATLHRHGKVEKWSAATAIPSWAATARHRKG